MTKIENLAFALLPILVLLHLFLVLRGKRQYTKFKSLTETEARQRALQKWVAESVLFYGFIPLLCLIAVGHGQAIFKMPEFLLHLSNEVNRRISSNEGGVVSGLISGMAMVIIPDLLFGHTAFALGRVYSEHKKKLTTRHAMLNVRDVEHLFPRNKDERLWTTLLSSCAGINEELCFRLLIPLLIFFVSGSAVFVIVLATLWFGLEHYYQGWFGVLITGLLGAIFMFVYIWRQQLWLVMLIHVILDLNDLAFAPWFADWLGKRRITNGSGK